MKEGRYCFVNAYFWGTMDFQSVARLTSTDWKSVVQTQLNPILKG